VAKHTAVTFDRHLQKLFDDRTHWLRRQVRKPGRGKAPSLNRAKVDRAIHRLQSLAEDYQLNSHAIARLRGLYKLKKQWHTSNKGWGIDQKRKAFVQWFDKNIRHDNCVYVFWAKRKCRYVGRTLAGKNRPQSQFQKYWFLGVTRVDIYASQGAREIPKLECLATHLFQPIYSKVKPAAQKWFSKCPICETRRLIRSELKAIFRLR